ncbi:NAD(P)-binding protein [Auriculariales sp. MPI-PUGE-AT-0066]|nr:NAD(P)-binding protein [Auriculariales sp. MPI-PUGE-AT-0066]
MSTQLTFTSFAVAGGTGGLGALVVKKLLAQGANVVVLGRTVSEVPDGATNRVVDYSDETSLVKALAGVEVVISALASAAAGLQPALATAAKQAGVRLFVPAEYGTDSRNLSERHPLAFKTALHKHLTSIDLPFTLYFNGYLSDFMLKPAFGFDIVNKKVSIVGEGKTPTSFTARPDVAHFMAFTLTHLPVARLNNAALTVEGEKATFLEVVAAFDDVFGPKFEVAHRDVDETQKRVKELGKAAFVDFAFLAAELGWVNVGENDNNLVPDWKPLTIRQTLEQFVKQ